MQEASKGRTQDVKDEPQSVPADAVTSGGVGDTDGLPSI